MIKKRALLFVAAGILSVALAGMIALQTGMLVRPSAGALAKLEEIPEFDILEWQMSRERELLRDYAAGEFTPEKPYVVLDPYDMNPLSALILFETERPTKVGVTVPGDDRHTALSYAVDGFSNHHEIPVLGLYPGRVNTVRLNVTDNSGITESVCIPVSTEPLPADFQTYSLVASKPARMESGLTLCIACFEHSYTCILDSRGQVRGYLSNRRMAHGTAMIQLENGYMLATGDEYRQVPYNMTSLWEFNWLGKVFREYEIPNAVHHGIRELPGGDILAVSNDRDLFASGTREDVAIVVDRSTGIVRREYDFRKILDETRNPWHHFHPDIRNVANIDWMHMNAAIADDRDNSLIVSSPTQSMVVKIDAGTSEIKWILGPHEGYGGSSSGLAKYLLTPEGGDFEWQWCQHDPMILPDQDGNPDTLDILLLDNGQSRSFTESGSVRPENNYSRGVQFRIDEKRRTVMQIWQYGKERGSECYATFLGDADYLPRTGNRLLTFGGQLRMNGVPTDGIVSGVLGEIDTGSRIVEVTESGEVVFEVAAKGNEYSLSAETYQAERFDLFSQESFRHGLGEAQGVRLGQSTASRYVDDFRPPLIHTPRLGVKFNDLHREGNRLVADGDLSYKGKTYLLGRAWLVFRSAGDVRVFAADSGLNGRFFASIDLGGLPAGEYRLSVAGAVMVGNDTQKGKMLKGHARTEYRITIR